MRASCHRYNCKACTNAQKCSQEVSAAISHIANDEQQMKAAIKPLLRASAESDSVDAHRPNSNSEYSEAKR